MAQSTREQLLAERARRQQLAGQAVQQVPEREAMNTLRNGGTDAIGSAAPGGRNEGMIDGVPLDQFSRSAPMERRDPVSVRAALEAEKERRALEAERAAGGAAPPPPAAAPSGAVNPFIATDAIPTGVESIDNPGQPRKILRGRGIMGGQGTVLQPTEYAKDSPEGRMRAAAARGVEFRAGAPFMVRLSKAWSLPNPDHRIAATKGFIKEMAEDRPADVPVFEWDEDLGQLVYYRRIGAGDVEAGLEKEENIGKYRATSMDEAGFGLGDLADMMDPAEIGSLVGSFVGTAAGPGKMTFWRASGKSGLGGAVGRDLGVIMQAMKSKYVDDADVGVMDVIKHLSTGFAQEMAAGFFGEGIYRMGRKAAGLPAPDFSSSNIPESGAAREEARDTADTMERVEEVTGRPYRVSEGEASQSNTLLQEEAIAKQQASSREKVAEERRYVENQEVREAFIQGTLRGDVGALGHRGGTIENIQATVREGGDIGMIVTKDRANPNRIDSITIGPAVALRQRRPDKLGTDMGTMNIRVRGGDTWQIQHVNDFGDLKGTGLGKETYIEAAKAARQHGANFASDSEVSGSAVKMWGHINNEVGTVKTNPFTATIDVGGEAPLVRSFDKLDDYLRWAEKNNIRPDEVTLTSDAGGAIFEMPKFEGVTDALLSGKVTEEIIEDVIQSSLLGLDGKPMGEQVVRKAVKHDPLDLFRRMSGNSTQLAAVAKELGDNPHQKARFLEEMYKRYETGILGKDGEFNMKAYRKWMDESKAMFNRILTPEEFTKLYNLDSPRAPGGLRDITNAAVNKARSLQMPLSRILKISEEDTLALLKDNDKVFTQMTKLYREDPKAWKRAMAILRQPGNEGQLHKLQELAKEEIYDRVRAVNTVTPTRKAVQKLGDSLLKDENFMSMLELIGDTTYTNDVKHVIRTMQTASGRQGIRGVGQEQAPPRVGFLKVLLFGDVFGRRQRLFTAGRKYALQKLADSSIRVVSDPALLREMVQLEKAPVTGRRAMQFLARAGILQAFGVENINDKEQVAQFEREWRAMQEEMAE